MLTKYPNLRHVVTALVVGIIVGAIAFGLALILEKYVFTPIGCVAGSSVVSCDNVGAISHNIALLFALGVGLTLLVRVVAFRPLLVILGSVVALWGIGARLSVTSWPVAFGLTALTFGLIFVLFTWLAMPRRFWLAALLVALTAVTLRVVLLV